MKAVLISSPVLLPLGEIKVVRNVMLAMGGAITTSISRLRKMSIVWFATTRPVPIKYLRLLQDIPTMKTPGLEKRA